MTSTQKQLREVTRVEVLPRRLTEADEHLHPTGTDWPERWQENMMLVGWDVERSVGFWFHIQRIPAKRFCELKYAVIGVNKGVSGRAQVPMPADCMYEGLTFVKPFNLLRLEYQGMGVSTAADTSLPCLAANGNIPVGMDITLNGLAGPTDWHIPLTELFPSIESDHYEMAGNWEGRLRLGDETINGSGLFYRDHTWGNRNYTPKAEQKVAVGGGGFEWAWWTPIVLDEGRTFFNGMTLRLENGQNTSFSTFTEGETTKIMPRHNVIVTDGVADKICRYRSLIIGGGTNDEPFDMQFQVHRHLPMYLPEHSPDFNQSDAFGPVTWGKRSGWGSAQMSVSTAAWKSQPEFEFDKQIAANS